MEDYEQNNHSPGCFILHIEEHKKKIKELKRNFIHENYFFI